MSGEELLRTSFVALEVNQDFSEATLTMRDQTRLCFCHRVGERWAKAVGTAGEESESSLAAATLARIALFRLNGKHLDISFDDGSRWEVRFPGSTRQPGKAPEGPR
jgi:hypothetical protein